MKNTLRILAAATLAALSLGAHAVGRLADIALHDRSTGRDLPVYWHEGRAYVVGKPGNEYEIRVANRAGEDLLAVMSVDGVNVISGETASPNGGGYVFSSWEQNTIRGWRKSMKDVAAFYFTSLGDSYAARTGRPDNVGVIGVALFQRKRVEPSPPAAFPESNYDQRERREESKKLLGAAAPSGAADAATRVQTEPARAPQAPLGTGHGRREHAPTRYVDFVRRSSEPAETIAIYYDSYRNLVAAGVLKDYAYRDPNPFPNRFVPDPR
jgi:hypothetical protein